jgi:hypothetical protein
VKIVIAQKALMSKDKLITMGKTNYSLEPE